MATITRRTMKMMVGALTLTMGLAGATAAQPAPEGRLGRPGVGRPGGRGGSPLGALLAIGPDVPLRALSLTDAQKEQVRTIVQSHRDESQSLWQRGHSAFAALRAATAGTVDEGAVAQHSQALSGLIAEAALLRARVRTEVLAVLTPEQQAEAAKIAAEHQARLQQRRSTPEQRRPQRQ